MSSDTSELIESAVRDESIPLEEGRYSNANLNDLDDIWEKQKKVALAAIVVLDEVLKAVTAAQIPKHTWSGSSIQKAENEVYKAGQAVNKADSSWSRLMR